MERARAKAESALFGCADPARFGRYEILEPIAAGGMGVVFGAYDPELDRRVALKVLNAQRLRDDRAAQQRLVVEARALAKLDHPNVVRVYDVLAIEEQIVIVMELVEGITLAEWTIAEPRTWQQIVEVYAQAGDGLAAAHEVGIIHRDFKPSNVIIGANGRVRVLDFGLARIKIEIDVSTALQPRSLTGEETSTGVVVGTLAYAAPEQLLGEKVTAASDQFSFCVSLHRSLEGVAPFDGSAIEAIVAQVRAGHVRVSDGAVPKWLRALLRRGMSRQPQQRHASLAALIAKLRQARGWQRWRRPLAGSALLGAAACAVFLSRSRAGAPACDGGAAELAAVWNPEIGRGLDAHIARVPAAPGADAKLVARTLEVWTNGWSRVHRTSCEAHRQGAFSAAMLDRTVACLHRRLDDLRGALAVSESADPRNVIDIVAQLPASEMCGNVDWLQSAAVEPPRSPAVEQRARELRTQLARISATDRAGNPRQALTDAAAAVRDAETLADGPVIAEAQLLFAKLLLHQQDERAEAVLVNTTRTALANGLTSMAVEAIARRMFAYGVRENRVERMQHDYEYGRGLADSVKGDHVARALLFNNAGAVHLAANQREAARRQFELAEAELRGRDLPDIELVCVDQNLADVTSDQPRREQLARRAWDRLRTVYGDRHLKSLEAAWQVSQTVESPEVALAILVDVCTGYREAHPELTGYAATCSYAVGLLAWVAGDEPQAMRALRDVVAMEGLDEDVKTKRQLVAAELALLEGRASDALVALVGGPAPGAADAPRWARQLEYHANLIAGVANRVLGASARARAQLSIAAAGFRALNVDAPDPMYRLAAARAELELSRL